MAPRSSYRFRDKMKRDRVGVPTRMQRYAHPRTHKTVCCTHLLSYYLPSLKKVNIKLILKTIKLDKRNQSFDVWFMTPMTFLPPACLYVYNMSAESRRWDPILLKLLWWVVSCPIWGLGTEPRSFARPASALEHWTTYLSSPCLWNCSVVVSFFLSVWILILKGFIFDQRNPSCCTKQGSARTAAGQRPTSVRERGAFMQLHTALVPVGITTKAFDWPNDWVIILPTFNWPGCILRGPTRCETPYSWCHL